MKPLSGSESSDEEEDEFVERPHRVNADLLELEDAISSDDRPRFISVVKSIYRAKSRAYKWLLDETVQVCTSWQRGPPEITTITTLLRGQEVEDPMLCPPTIYRWIIDYNAVNCAAALLEGETGLEKNLCERMRGMQTTPLIEAAARFSYELVYLFILHGAEMNDVARDRDTGPFLPPLQYALQRLNFIFDSHLQLSSAKESVYKLVILFCLPHLKGVLETIRLLAWATIDVNKFFYHYATKGDLIEMVPLLMVAAERSVAPVDLQSISNYYGVVNVHQGIKKGIESLDVELMELSKHKRDDSVQMCKRKRETLENALLLIDLFERAGDAIVSYLQSPHFDSNMSIEVVVKEVSAILRKAGFDFKEEDTDLSNISSKYYEMKAPEGSSRAHRLWCELKEHKGSPAYTFWRDLNLLFHRSSGILGNAKGEPRTCQLLKQLQQRKTSYPTSPYDDSFDRFYFYTFARSYSSSTCKKPVKAHFKGEINATKRCILPSQSSCLLSSLALSCKRWMKYI